jgi:hypothetical protein
LEGEFLAIHFKEGGKMAQEQQNDVDVKSLLEVPEDVLTRGKYPPIRYRELPAALPWHKMLGPSIIVAGLAIGSGELIFWPYLTYTYGLAIIWAGIVGVTTQFFINMEIERYTLLTGETSVAGFGRLWHGSGWIFLICVVIPLMWPGWVAGSAKLLSWTLHPGASDEAIAGYQRIYAIISVILCGSFLILSPVVYRFMEKLQEALVAFVFLVLAIACIAVVKGETFALWFKSAGDLSYLREINAADAWPVLLGAIAYAGMGGMTNMIQGHYIREKGFAMGAYAGKIVSPITGKEDIKFAEAGFFFKLTPENIAKWRQWWKSANLEHFASFLCLTAISIVLLSFLAYDTVFGVEGYGRGIDFIRGEAEVLSQEFGGFFKYVFLIMGWAILFTSQIGVLDLFSRLCTDIIKWSWLKEKKQWTESRIYVILVVALTVFAIIVFAGGVQDPRTLLTIGAALNGIVMFLYSFLLLYMNRLKLPKEVRISGLRSAIMVWAIVFFGFFSILTIKTTIEKLFG